MASLENIVENIAYSLDNQFNHTLKESVKNSVIDYRALLIRQDLENNALSYTDFLQSVCIEFEKVPSIYCPEVASCPAVQSSGFVLKGKQKLAKPVRLKNNGRTNFKFVGSIDRSKSFTFEVPQALQFVEALGFQEGIIYYTIIDGYPYILNNLNLCKALFEYIVANPEEVETCEDDFTKEKEFPIASDMLVAIKRMIRRDFNKPQQDGEEVNIQKDLNDKE